MLGALPGVIGSLQALETVKLITGAGEPLIGRLLLFDGLGMKWREMKLRRNPACPVCGDEPTVTALIDYEEFCGVAEPGREASPAGGDGSAPNAAADGSDPSAAAGRSGATGVGAGDEAVPDGIGAAELKERLDRGADLDLIDVREPYEWRIFNLGDHGARLIPLGQLESRLGELDPEREIVFYCRSGHRSGDVTRYLRQRGWDRVRNLEGGILAWGDEVDPSTPRY